MKLVSRLLVLILFSCSHMSEKKSKSDLLVKGFIYGYPLVMMDLAEKRETNVEESNPQMGFAPVNKIVHLPKEDEKILTSKAWIDVSQEPLVLEVPDTQSKFYQVHLIDAWTNFFMPIEEEYYESNQNFLIVGPNWEKEFGSGVEFLRMPTSITYVVIKTDDEELRKKFRIYPYKYFGKEIPKTSGVIDSKVDMRPVRELIFSMNGRDYFNLLNELMVDNPPTGDDYELIQELEKIGIGPALELELAQLSKKDKSLLRDLPRLAEEKFKQERAKLLEPSSHWTTLRGHGAYKTDYRKRAIYAYIGKGITRDEEVLFPFICGDFNGRPLIGESSYKIHFEQTDLPPVSGAWSVNIYKKDDYLKPGTLPVSTMQTGRKLKLNRDKSIDIYLQKNAPVKDKMSNWVRIPDGEFVVEVVMFRPRLERMPEDWTLPAIIPLRGKLDLTLNTEERSQYAD